ncbi:RsmB/NOP family class I SAM-dependent RNA methyltransferase [uncultured Enorma sp.]|uniref:RsmB/NOP family class I SAM-dependent RNA methyltransferase n=1 Tax=uncultured Enorma sp. TaxID=1714346 RepID=UPI0028061DF2|nr:RsmB/NOP family class I SAM-dependent RNA methyltransferase [uncultured Enorma sp.]
MSEAFEYPELIDRAISAYGNGDGAECIRAGFEAAATRPVTLRANTAKASADSVTEALRTAGIGFTRVTWYDDAFVLDDGVCERDVWELPIYREGKIYLQSLSSMLPPLVLEPRTGADVLDMCAAPGGKTSQLYALANGRAHITACELHAPRAEKLAYNLAKLGCKNVNVMRCDARKLDEFFSFDQILLDAPCTGTGTFRSGDERATKRMTEALLAKVTRSQRALLDRALTVLKPGGTLVYATCSILPQENNEQVAYALKRHRDCKLVPLFGGASTQEDESAPLSPGVRAIIDAVQEGAIPALPTAFKETLTVCPSKLFEGFYLALIKK